MALTPKQEAFAQCIANGMSQADAYRTAFEVGEDTKATTIYPEASKLMDNPNIATRVQGLKDKLAEMALWKRLDSVRVLADIAQGVDDDAKASDRVNAVKALNAMHGWDAASKIEVSGNMNHNHKMSLDDFYGDPES